jgi:site-specific recombinase XerD
VQRPDTRCSKWRRVIERANLAGFDGDARFHDLRHSYASNLLHGNVPMHVVSRVLGHSSITVTVDCYGHIAPTTDQQILDALRATTQKGRRHLVAA